MVKNDDLFVSINLLIVMHCYFFGTKIQIRCRGRWTRLASPRFNLLRAGRSPLQKYLCLRTRFAHLGSRHAKRAYPAMGLRLSLARLTLR